MMSLLLLGVGGRGATTPPLPTPTVITSFPVGDMAGQRPLVLVRDVTNDFDLYDRNADVLSDYPASCTKLMTLLLAYEYKSSVWTSETIDFNSGDVAQPIGGLTMSMAGFGAGDIMTWESAAYGLLLPSGADACLGIARHIGDLLYANAGNTGNQGLVRFVERMNERGAELGVAGVFVDPFGGSKSVVGGPTVIRNQLSPRDLVKMCVAAMSSSVIRAMAMTVSKNITITGPSARTMTLTTGDAFVNGPLFDPAGIADADVLGGKGGTWDHSGSYNNRVQLWRSPAGYEVAIATIESNCPWGCILDQKGLMYSMLRDFPYLSGSVPIGSDPNWSNVRMLVGGDGSIIDESTDARALTNVGVTLGDSIVDSAGGLVIDNTNDGVHTADAADITVGSGNMTIEEWYTGPGSAPGGEYVFFIKAGPGQLEWTIDYNAGFFQLFASAFDNGASWTSANAKNFNPSIEPPTFFNGAPRHIALVKNGSELSIYLCGEKMPGVLTMSNLFDGSGQMAIANPIFGGSSPLGRIDDFRATFGTARYTAKMVTIRSRKFPRG